MMFKEVLKCLFGFMFPFNSQCWMTFKEVSMITWKRNDSSSQGSIIRHSYFTDVDIHLRI